MFLDWGAPEHGSLVWPELKRGPHLAGGEGEVLETEGILGQG